MSSQQIFLSNSVFKRHLRVEMDFRVKGMVNLEQILNVAGLTTIDDDLKVTGKITHRKPVESINTTTHVTLTTAQSGTTFYVSQETADIIINLPSTPEIGTYYKFITDGVSTHIITINAVGTPKFNGVWSYSGGVTPINHDTSIVFATTNTTKGDFFTVEAITSGIWHTYACTDANNALTLS